MRAALVAVVSGERQRGRRALGEFASARNDAAQREVIRPQDGATSRQYDVVGQTAQSTAVVGDCAVVQRDRTRAKGRVRAGIDRGEVQRRVTGEIAVVTIEVETAKAGHQQGAAATHAVGQRQCRAVQAQCTLR